MNQTTLKASIVSILLLTAGSAFADAYTFVPCVYGFGTDTRGPYVGSSTPAILHVDTLEGEESHSDSTHGSLLWALRQNQARIVVFDVAGVIEWADDRANVEIVTDGNLWVAGQSSPGRVVLHGNAGLWFTKGSNIVIQYLTFRGRSFESDNDIRSSAVTFSSWQGDISQCVVDHVSVAWNSKGSVSTWPPNGPQAGHPVSDVTFSNVLGAEGLQDHSCGALLSGNNILIRDTLFAHNNNRHPFVKVGANVAFWNNVVYNYRYRVAQLSGDYDYQNQPSILDFRGNDVIYGPDSPQSSSNQSLVQIMPDMDNNHAQVHMTDNIKDGALVDGYDVENLAGIPYESNTPITVPNTEPLASSSTYANVLAHAGDRPAQRDAVDARIISEVEAGTGSLTSTPRTMPDYPEIHEAFVPVANPHEMFDQYYTNLEHQLHELAAALDGAGGCGTGGAGGSSGSGGSGGSAGSSGSGGSGGSGGTSGSGGSSGGSGGSAGSSGAAGAGGWSGVGGSSGTAGIASANGGDDSASGCACGVGKGASPAGALGAFLFALGLLVRRRYDRT